MITSGGIKFIPHVVINILALCLIIVFIIRSKAIFFSAMTIRRMMWCLILSAAVLFLNLYLNRINADVISYVLALLYISISLLFLYICSLNQLVLLLKDIGLVLNILVMFSLPMQIFLGHAMSTVTIDGLRYNYIIPGMYYSGKLIQIETVHIYRVCLFFWEPGVLGVYLVIYLSLIIDMKNRIRFVLACLCIVLTLSTTANILLVILVTYRFRKMLTRNWWKYLAIVLFAGFIGILLVIPIIKSKFTGEELSSALVRYYDSEMSLSNALDHPFWGSGLMDPEKYSAQRAMRPFRNILRLPISEDYKKYVLDRSKGGNTNSFFNFAESFGIIVFVFFVYGMFRKRGFPEGKNIFSIVVLISIASEPLLLTPLFLIFFFQGFADKMSEKRNETLWSQQIYRSSQRLIMPPNF
jgi:hypothetical protein